jgi:hypothetical protein
MNGLVLTSGRGHLRRRSIAFDDAVEVWKRHYFFGESQEGIAQAFGVDQRRIRAILLERRHIGSRLVALGKNPLTRQRTH